MGVKLPTRKLDSITGWNVLVDLTEERSDGIRAVMHSLALLEHLLDAREAWEEKMEDLAAFPK